jgi:hypothetical protein
LTTLFHPSNHQGLLYPYNKLEHVDDDVHGVHQIPYGGVIKIYPSNGFRVPSRNEIYNIILTSLRASAGSSKCSACDPATIFLTSKFIVVYFSSNPTHKTKTGITNRWETTNSKAPGPIMAKGAESRRIYYTPFWQVLLGCAVLFTSLSKQCNKKKMLGQNHFACWAKLACFDFSSSDFNLWGSHIWSTCWVCSYR